MSKEETATLTASVQSVVVLEADPDAEITVDRPDGGTTHDIPIRFRRCELVILESPEVVYFRAVGGAGPSVTLAATIDDITTVEEDDADALPGTSAAAVQLGVDDGIPTNSQFIVVKLFSVGTPKVLVKAS